MSQNPTVEEVLQRIRARVAERNGGVTATGSNAPTNSRPASAFPDNSLRTVILEPCDLSGLHAEIDVALEGTRRVGQLNPRNPGLVNSCIQFVKKVMRRSLTWYTRPIHYFQGGAIRSLQQTEKILQSFNRSLQLLAVELSRQSELAASNDHMLKSNFLEVRDKIAFLENKAAELSDGLIAANREQADHIERLSSAANDIARLQAHFTEQQERLRDLQLNGRLRDRDIRRFLQDLRSGNAAGAEADKVFPVPPMFPTGLQRERDFDYFAFEEVYRGDEAAIRDRQNSYLECFRGRQNVLDVGCGRGEFLELLRDNGISAKGVELGTDQYLLCREKGLDVTQQDMFAYLESLPDESLGGLFSAQVIEHLTASDQLRYVRLSYEKTTPGSPVIFETINAQCVWAVMRNFFLDPTHVRPIHPETLKFAMETVKFKDVELRFSSPMQDRALPPLPGNGNEAAIADFNRRLADLNEFLYGNQDYAAIGWH